MREIGGYIELDTYHLQMLHEDAIALNCGRNCLAYLFRSRKIKKIRLPYFICSSVPEVCDREGIEKKYYHIGTDFRPFDILLDDDEWLYLVNYYGQISNAEIIEYANKYKRIIVDNANAYFQYPVDGVDTLYTCRKWFGVADGAFLYTDHLIKDDFPIDESYDRMSFLLGRFERTASEFYKDYVNNNSYFSNQPIKRMSKLTSNLLHGIDYSLVQAQRLANFDYLHSTFKSLNQLELSTGLFMYPLKINNGAAIRKTLQEKKIYIPLLWPSVFDITYSQDFEYQLADNILPLPIDQRYNLDDMKYIAQEVLACMY